MIHRFDAHGGQSVSCMEFNPQKSSLLGTGGCDGTVQVVNIERPTHPDVFHNVTTTKHTNSEVVCLAWNRKVQHILATASNQGLTVVWDLKNKKEVISFKDPANRSRCSALSWNPDIPTQLMVAYNDDTSPCVQLWDMRNCNYPFREFQEHSRGVTAASYCDHDSNLIISSARDNRTFCWSLQDDKFETFSELNLGCAATKIDWSSNLPGFIAASSSTGTVSVHSVLQKQTAAPSQYLPKWIRVPCGVSFGFGGKVVIFGSKQTSHVQIHVIADEPDVAQGAEKFDEFLSTDLRPYCKTMKDVANDEHERVTWELLSVISDGVNDRRGIAAVFGMNLLEVQSSIDEYLGRTQQKVDAVDASRTERTEQEDRSFPDPTSLDSEQLDNFFDQLAKNTESMRQSPPPVSMGSRRGTPRAAGIIEEIGDVTDWSNGPEALIRRCILIGDFKGAVECCMKCGKYTDALLLAASGDKDLWKSTREEYTRRQRDPFVRQLGYILSNDLEKLVVQSDLSEWPETLALLTTYADNESYGRLVELLATRLEKERFDVRSAVLCFMACGSFDQTVRIWASMSHSQTSQCGALQDLVEKMSCLYAAIRPQTAGPIFSAKLTQYAALLANSGRTTAAMRFLMLIPDSAETRILKDRIYNAAPSVMAQIMRSAPPFPFDFVDIRPASIHTHHQIGSFHGQVTVPQQPSVSTPSRGYQPSQVPPQYQSARPIGAPTTTTPSHAPRAPIVSPQPGVPVTSSNQVVHPGGSHNHNIQSQSHHQQHLPVSPSVTEATRNMGASGVVHSNFVRQPQQSMTSPVPPSPAMPGPARPLTQVIPQRVVPHGISSNGTTTQANVLPSHPVVPNPAVTSSGYAVGGTIAPPSAPSQRVVVGPPTSGGVSTAPHVTARSVTAGMPVPWPVPTAVQQQLTPNSVAPPIGSPSSPAQVSDPMTQSEVATIQRSLQNLLQRCSQDGNARKWDDTSRKLNDLYEKLLKGHMSIQSREKVKDLVACIDQGDFAHASRLRVELSATDWERNRTWLFALQLLLPK